MKKILLVVMVTLISSSNAFEDFQATTHKKEETRTTFLDADSPLIQEYEDWNDRLQHLDEYDQNITDNVTPPQVSTAEAMFKEALGTLLVRYISLREVARTYFREIKDILAQWYGKIIKA